jgi:enoyl-CoA hydratase
MTYETLLLDVDSGVATVRLDRPERMNAVIEQMYTELLHALARVRDDGDVRVLILTGSVRRRPEGDKQAFCAGADLKEHGAGRRTPHQKREYIELAHETTRQLYTLPQPTIAVVNGPARGAGAEMALNCDFVLMADTATLAFPETSLGTFVGGGVTRHLAQLVGMAQAKRLVYTGAVLDGAAAAALGLALASHPLDELMPAARELASSLASRAPISMAFAKELMQKAPRRDLETALLAETEAITACMGTEDWQEGLDAFAQQRPPVYRGR